MANREYPAEWGRADDDVAGEGHFDVSSMARMTREERRALAKRRMEDFSRRHPPRPKYTHPHSEDEHAPKGNGSGRNTPKGGGLAWLMDQIKKRDAAAASQGE